MSEVASLKPTNGSTFLNGIACELGVKDIIEEVARQLLPTVIDRIKFYLEYEKVIRDMVDAGKWCSNIADAKDEMLHALKCIYGLKDPFDIEFAAASERVLEFRKKADKKVIWEPNALLTIASQLEKQADDLKRQAAHIRQWLVFK